MPHAADIDQLLRGAVARGEAAGVVAVATDAHGTLYQGAAGRRDLSGQAPMTPDTVFWIHSMTKALTAAGCMQLVEQGRLSLDAPVGDLVPALAAPRVLTGFDDDGTPRLRPAAGPITLRQLLTHTAGFSYDMWNADMLRYGRFTGMPRADTFRDAASCLPLAFDPGTGWSYGVSIDWAGKALEAASGQTLDAWLREHLLGPLGMHDTGFLLRPEISARLARPHERQPDGGLRPVDFAPPQDPRHFLGGGGMYGTAPDYLRFIRMMLNGGTLDGARVLQPETVALMGRNHMGALDVPPMRTAMPAVSNDCDLFPGMVKKWGLSFLINTADVPGRRAAGSLAWAGLRNTYFWIDPARGVGGVLMTQVQPFSDEKVLDLLAAFETAIYAGR